MSGLAIVVVLSAPSSSGWALPEEFLSQCPMAVPQHSQVDVDELPSREPTTVFWVINPYPTEKVLRQLLGSMFSVASHRAPGETLQLIVVVYPRRVDRLSPVTCAGLVNGRAGPRNGIGAKLPDLHCEESTVTWVARSCVAAPPARETHRWPLTLRVITVGGAWDHHPTLQRFAAMRRSFFANKRHDRLDLMVHGEQSFFRYTAHGLLLPLGVRRAVYLDADCVAYTSLRPLHRSRLSGYRTVAVSPRCLNDLIADRFNTKHPLVRHFGFRNESTQEFNTGVMVLDLVGICNGRGDEELVRLAEATLRDIKDAPFDSRTGAYDQVLCNIAWARNVSMVDPRWNCRRPRETFSMCRVVHAPREALQAFDKAMRGLDPSVYAVAPPRRGRLRRCPSC